MAVTTTVHDNFSKTAFFDSREWLNQENWQMYFGGALPSGVLVKGKLETSGINYISALARHEISSSYIQFHPGSIMANGIYAYYASGTSIPVIKSAEIDRLFVARVYVTAGYVRIVGMTKVAAEYGYTPTVFAKMLLQDESLAMTRNSTYYDIPLLYEVFGGDKYDLRRLIYLPGQAPDVDIDYSDQNVSNIDTVPGILYGKYFVQTYGGMNYNVNFLANDTSPYFYVYPNPSCSEKPTIVKLVNNSSTVKQIRIPLTFKSLTLSYSWLENWDTDPNTRHLYKDMVAGDRMTLVFTPNGHETTFNYTVTNKSSASGGGIDPDDYFTKQEIAAQMLLKANVSDMDDALALKEDKSALGDLAYQNEADYATQVSNKPTLGALAAKDQAALTTDVLGVLPVENGGTGASDLAGIANNIFDDVILYVDDDNGSDTNGNGTQSNPYKTIQFAIDKVGVYKNGYINIKYGSYLISKQIEIPKNKKIILGVYSGDTVTIQSSESSKATIFYVNGGTLIIKQGTFSLQNGGIFINNHGNLTIKNSTSDTIKLITTHISIKNFSTFYFESSANIGNKASVQFFTIPNISTSSYLYIDNGSEAIILGALTGTTISTLVQLRNCSVYRFSKDSYDNFNQSQYIDKDKSSVYYLGY